MRERKRGDRGRSRARVTGGPGQDPLRIQTLSDGVFAVALTLLIIDVVATGKNVAPGEQLADHLLAGWPSLTAYLVGFMTILVCWINHHRVFFYVSRTDSGLVWVNGVMLALVAAVPLPTAVLAKYLTGGEGQRAAFILYGLTCLLMDLSLWGLCSYTHRRRLTDPSLDPERYEGMKRSYQVGAAWTALALGAAAVNVYVALVLWAAMFAVYAFPAEFAHFLSFRSRRR